MYQSKLAAPTKFQGKQMPEPSERNEIELIQIIRAFYRKKITLSIGAVFSLVAALLFYFAYVPSFEQGTQLLVKQSLSGYQFSLVSVFPITVPEVRETIKNSELKDQVKFQSLDLSQGILTLGIEIRQPIQKHIFQTEFNNVIKSILGSKVEQFKQSLLQAGIWKEGGQFEIGKIKSKFFETKYRLKWKVDGREKFGLALAEDNFGRNIQSNSEDEIQSAVVDTYRYIAVLNMDPNYKSSRPEHEKILSDTELLWNLYNVIQKIPDMSLLSEVAYGEPFYATIKLPKLGRNILASGLIFVFLFGAFTLIIFLKDSLSEK